MRTVLGRKQTSTNKDWLYAVQHIEEIITPQEVAEYAARAVGRIKAVTAGKKAAYAWSAGKDSIVLGKLCEQAGVTSCFFGHSDLEFPQYLDWALAHLPKGCEVLNVHLDLDWLAKHQDMMFIDDAFRLNKWYGLLQRSFFSAYYEQHKPDYIIVGHRIIDGNTCGKDHIIRKKSGETRFAAIADWPHEAILGYCRRYIAMDYGTANPMVFLDVLDDGTTFWVQNEYYYDARKAENQASKTDHEYGKDFDAFVGEDHSLQVVIDPSALSFKAELRNRGYRVKEADNEVLDGIRITATLIGQRRIRVRRGKCPNFEREVESYVWDEKLLQRGEEGPVKENDHAMDAIRYLCKTLVNRRRLAQ